MATDQPPPLAPPPGALAGVRVINAGQIIAAPFCGTLLAEFGADVIKVEPPAGDGYRHVVPVAPGLGRYFVPLNRGKRSVVLDLKREEGRARCHALVATADVVLHNYPPARADAFGLGWEELRSRRPGLVLGVVSSFGSEGTLAGRPAYDLVAQAHAGLLTAHASAGDRVPVRAGGIPIADLAAGLLLSVGVLAALVRARETGVGERVETSLLAAALAVQLQDVLRLPGDETFAEPRVADPADLERRAGEIARDLSLDPYYRCSATADGFVAVACLNVAQRRALLAELELDDPSVVAPDSVPHDPAALAVRRALTDEVERRLSRRTTAEWVRRLERAGVPSGPVHVQASALADPQARANGLVTTLTQEGLGDVETLGRLVQVGAGIAAGPAVGAPALGEHTETVLGELG